MPNRAQQVLLNKHIGSCRFVYNLALETKLAAYAGNMVSLDCFDLIKQLPDLKKECVWLREINSQSLQQSISHLDNAFTKFYKGQADFPNFKNRSSKKVFNVPQNTIVDFERSKLIIPRFKKGIDIILHRDFEGAIKQATVGKTSTGRYFASILVETGTIAPEKAIVEEATTVGIDLGLKTFLVTSDGQEIDNPRFLKKQMSRLKYVQSRYSKNKGKQTKHKLAVLHEKVANQRRDFLNKISSKLISENQTICIEDLNIKGMSATCKPKQDENGKYLPNGQAAKSGLNQSITDAGWGMFVDMLKYKAEWYGKNILQIGRFEASSKTCSCCGSINKELTLEDRGWICQSCGSILDRDFNAAVNIKNFALKTYLSAEHRLENQNELPALVGVMTSEAPMPLG